MSKPSPNRKLNQNDSILATPLRENQLNNNKILDKLEEQKNSDKLTLADLFIGDEGVKHIASFLKVNTHYKAIELRGNNISGQGFAIACEALKSCPNLQSISAEWNNIGSDVSGIQMLNVLVRKSTTIKHIDLRNNKLGSNCGLYLADTVRDTISLETLDLRWNELGNEGVKYILSALVNSKHKVQVDVNGNKISEEVLAEFQEVYTTNNSFTYKTTSTLRDRPSHKLSLSQFPEQNPRFSPPHSYQKPLPPSNNNESFLQKSNISGGTIISTFLNNSPSRDIGRPSIKLGPGLINSKIPNNLLPKATPARDVTARTTVRTVASTTSSYRPELDLKEIQMRYEMEAREIQEKYEQHIEAHLKMSQALNDLEAQLLDEKNNSQSLEQKLQEAVLKIEADGKFCADLEKRLAQLGNECAQKDETISELEKLVVQQQSQLEQANLEINELKNDLLALRDEANYKIRQLEQSYNTRIAELTGEIQAQKRNEDKLILDNENRLIELNKECDRKLRAQDQQFNEMENTLRHMEREIASLTAHAQSLEREKDEALAHQAQVIRDNEASKFQVTLKAIESRLKQTEELKDFTVKKNQDLTMELQRVQKELSEVRLFYDGDLKKTRYEIEDYKGQIGQLSSINNKLKCDISEKENMLKRMEKDLYNYENEIQRNKEIHGEQLKLLRIEHDKDVARWERLEQELNAKLMESEKMYKMMSIELQQARNEYNKLADLLQGNVSKVISKTLLEYQSKSALTSGYNSENI